MAKRVILAVSIGLLALSKVDAQEFYIPDSVIEATRTIFIEDSIRFMTHLNSLLTSENRETIERASIFLDELSYMSFIKKHSTEIIQKLNSIDGKNSHHYRLLSLCNPPDSIREVIMKTTCNLSKARLGDSVAIAYHINEYVLFRDRDDLHYSFDGMRHCLRVLLSLNSKTALDIIFNDVQSTRIIKKCIDPVRNDPENCFWTDYTHLYAIIGILMTKHLNEPILNHPFIVPLIRIAYPKDNLPQQLPGFFRTLEDFILREYGYSVKINVPFVLAAPPF